MVGFVFSVINLVGIVVRVIWSCLCCSSPRFHCKPLPSDLLVDILKRLPAEDLLRYKKVCREWNSLISTPNFQHMHVNYGGAVPTIAVQLNKPNKFVMLFLEDKCRGILRKVKESIMGSRKNMKIEVMTTNNSWSQAVNSDHGLILIEQSRGLYMIFNPITREQVTFQCDGLISAFFYHPFANDYYALIWKKSDEQQNDVPEVKLLTLSSLLSNNLDSGKKISSSIPSVAFSSPIIQRDAIYWIAAEFGCEVSGSRDFMFMGTQMFPYFSCGTLILIFDIKEEEFHLISHPEDGICYRGGDEEYIGENGDHSHLRLFEKEGLVSFCDFSFIRNTDKLKIQIWNLLEDYSWGPKETIILEMMFPFTDSDWGINIVHIGTLNGELILSWEEQGVFAYNLKLGTLRELYHDSYDHFFIHNKTILSLKSVLQKAQM